MCFKIPNLIPWHSTGVRRCPPVFAGVHLLERTSPRAGAESARNRAGEADDGARTPTAGWNGKPHRDAANRLKQAAIRPRSRRDGGITANQPRIAVIALRITVISLRIAVIALWITVIPLRITVIPLRIAVIPLRIAVIPLRITV